MRRRTAVTYVVNCCPPATGRRSRSASPSSCGHRRTKMIYHRLSQLRFTPLMYSLCYWMRPPAGGKAGVFSFTYGVP